MKLYILVKCFRRQMALATVYIDMKWPNSFRLFTIIELNSEISTGLSICNG